MMSLALALHLATAAAPLRLSPPLQLAAVNDGWPLGGPPSSSVGSSSGHSESSDFALGAGVALGVDAVALLAGVIGWNEGARRDPQPTGGFLSYPRGGLVGFAIGFGVIELLALPPAVAMVLTESHEASSGAVSGTTELLAYGAAFGVRLLYLPLVALDLLRGALAFTLLCPLLDLVLVPAAVVYVLHRAGPEPEASRSAAQTNPRAHEDALVRLELAPTGVALRF